MCILVCINFSALSSFAEKKVENKNKQAHQDVETSKRYIERAQAQEALKTGYYKKQVYINENTASGSKFFNH